MALFANTTGAANVAVGAEALDVCTTGAENTVLGYRAGDSITTGNNNTCIGSNSDTASATATHSITLGNADITTLRCADTSISSLSDRRDKTDIIDLPVGLDFINSLIPRQFKWKTREGSSKDGFVRAGFIAQELQEAQKNCDYLDLVMNENPDKLEAKQGKLVPVLVKAIQELSAKVTALEAG